MLVQPPDHRQHVVTQKLNILGQSLATELMSQASAFQGGGTPNLKNLFTLAKGYQGARKSVGPPRPSTFGWNNSRPAGRQVPGPGAGTVTEPLDETKVRLDNHSQRLVVLEEKTTKQEKRVTDLEADRETVHNLVTTIGLLAAKVQELAAGVDSIAESAVKIEAE